MAAPPIRIPPPYQSHQQEQSENDILPTNITFRQPQLYFLSPLSGQNPKTVGSAAAAVGATAESSKKRGRPRKAPADGNTGAAGAPSSSSSKKPSKKAQGRTPGSRKMHQEPEASGAVGFGSMRHLPVRIGKEIGIIFTICKESIPLQHQQSSLVPTGTMAAPPTRIPPPSQSHQQEQSENDILPTNITFRQPQPYLLSPLSGQNPKFVGSTAAADGGYC